MPINAKYLSICVIAGLLLCVAQIAGSTVLILACLAAYIVVMAWGCSKNFTLPLLLFFLPWSPLLKTGPGSFSFYTIGLVLICAMSMLKKGARFKRYHLVLGIVLVILTLISKLLDGGGLSFDYIAFMMLIILLPVVKNEMEAGEYDFYQSVVFFSVGIILAALCARQFAVYPNIKKYITVHSYLTITRMCGFYGDPNFYAAQVTAAMGGGLVLILERGSKKRTAFLGVLIFTLLYCGLLSASKSFVLVAACEILLWVIEILRMRGKTGLKIGLVICGSLAAIFVATSAMFSGLIDVIRTRFSFSNDLSDFTTGRTELWLSYLDAFLSDGKLLVLGRGFTNVKVNGRAPHNTIIQIIFQFGVLGTPFLAAWSIYLFKDIFQMRSFRKKEMLTSVLMITGAFMPWLALDMLYFDDFFLLQWFCFMGLKQLHSAERATGTPVQATGEKTPRRGKSRLRIAWRR